MAKRILKVNPVLGTDEVGKPVIFTIPFHGLYFETEMVSRECETTILGKGIQNIISEAEEYDDRLELLLFTDEDKKDLIKQLKRTGRWLK